MRRIFGILVAILVTGTSQAQTARPLGATPIAPTREEIERSRPVAPNAPGPRLVVEDKTERAPCALGEPRFAAVEVTLTAVTFAGLKIVQADELRPAYDGQLGKPLPIAVVCEIRDRAATILRAKGYLAAVQIPPQKIEGGKLELHVLLARLASIHVRGNAGRAERLIAGYLTPLTREPLFNERHAERALLLVRDLPGYDVRLQLQPSDIPGEVIGEVTVVHHTIDADFNVQNYSSRELGRFGGLVRVQFYGLTGLGDRTAVSFFTSPEIRQQKVVQASHEFLLGSSAIGVAGHFTYSWTKPTLNQLDIDARALVGSGEIDFPFVRRQAANIRGAAGFEVIDQTVDLNGVRLTTDRLRVPFVRIEGDAIDHASRAGIGGYSAFEPRWSLAGTFELRHGVHILGASQGCGVNLILCRLSPNPVTPSRPYGDPAALVVRFGGEAQFRPRPRLAFVFTPRAQYTPDTLLSFEEYSGGNYTIGRGYDPGALLGDKGLGGALEVRAGRAAPAGPRAIAVQPFAFVDSAWLWSNSPGDPRAAANLTSLGFGLRTALGGWGRLDGSFAFPTGRVGIETHVPPVRFLVSFTTRLPPWSRR